MFYCIINCLLYIVSLCFYYVKRKSFDTYFVLLAAYAITAILCLCNVIKNPALYSDIHLFPFFYLYICLLIFLSPYKGLKLGKQVQVINSFPIKVLTWIYILSGFIAIYYTLPDATDLIRSGEWGMLRRRLYSDQDIILYHSLTEKLAKNIHSYLEPFGIVMCFYYLTLEKKNTFIIICAFTSYLGYAFLSSTLVASRGMVVNFMLQLALLFVLFKDSIANRVKRKLGFASLLLCIPLIMYLFAVSISRFGETDAASSTLGYLGHSMLNFNQGVMSTMHDYANGKYFFEYFINLLGGDSTIDLKALGYTGGTGFYTFIGDFYIDWGPIGTVFFAILVSAFLRSFTRKRRFKLSDLVIIVFFASYFMNGVFVIGRGSALSWVMCGVVYIILRFLEITKTN